MKVQFEMYGDGVRPTKATRTRWIDHKICAMEHVVNKYRLYCQHLQHAITDTKKSKDRATIQGKFSKLMDTKILLRSCFFVDVLTPAKIFSLQTQKSDISIINIVDCVDTTKRNYKKLLKQFESDKNNAFVLLPTLKSVINEIENSEDGEPEYQGQKLKFYLNEKEYLKNHCINIIKAIVMCYEDRYSSILSDNNNESSGISDDENMEISDGDSMLFDVCCILNTKVWLKLQEGRKDDENLSLQLNSVKNLFEKFNNMEVFQPVSIDSLIDGYSDIVHYAYCYFNIEYTEPMKLWSKLLIIGKNKEHWKDIMFF